jgi:hypothetical protein
MIPKELNGVACAVAQNETHRQEVSMVALIEVCIAFVVVLFSVQAVEGLPQTLTGSRFV